jgi:hypothetical protein
MCTDSSGTRVPPTFLIVEISEHVPGCHCTLDCKTKPYTINTPILWRISSYAMNRHNLAYFGKGPLWDPPVWAPSVSSLNVEGSLPFLGHRFIRWYAL